MEKLSKDTLNSHLEDWFGCYREEHSPIFYKPIYQNRAKEIEQAYNQLKEIIEEHDSVASWMDRCHELELEIAELNKPKQVSREDIVELLHTLQNMVGERLQLRKQIKIVSKFFKKFGIKVVE